MKRKILAIVLCIAMLAIAIVGSTLAYFTDSEAVSNVIVVGNVSAELYESRYHRGATGDSYLKMTGQPEPLTDADIVADDATYEAYLESAKLMPFDLKSSHRVQSMFEECTVAKNAYVQNTSATNDCYVRISYTVPKEIAPYLDVFYSDTQFISANDAVATADARTLDNSDKTEPMITAVNSTAANFALQATKVDSNGNYVAEFIYAERLLPGEFTQYSPVSKITLIPTVTEETIAALNLTDRQFNVEVKAEVIQADGFFNAIEAFAAFDAQ